jgi:peroxiredoxin Q/BCP
MVLGVVVLAAVLVYAYRQSTSAGAPAPGDMVTKPAPEFSLPKLGGGEVTLSSFYGKRNVLVFFNEGYGCAPCWQQAVELQEDIATFAAMETEVFAVMVDPPDLLKAEASRWGLGALPILVDESRKVSKSYDALGGMHADKPNHTFVLISADGRVLWDADYPSMRVSREAVVQQVRTLLVP